MEFCALDRLYLWLADMLHSPAHKPSTDAGLKYANLLHRCVQYMWDPDSKTITLTNVGREMYVNPSYLYR